MPMIDVIVPVGLIPAARHSALLRTLAETVIRHEGNEVRSPYAEHTAAFLHELPGEAVATAASAPDVAARVQVLTPPGVLTRDQQRALVADVTRLVAESAGDAALAARTWVLLTEAAEGGWGIAGTAFGRAEFAAAAGAHSSVGGSAAS